MRILFACGGTGGHINPALAIAGKFKEILPESEFLFIGAGRTMEKELIPAAGYKLENLEVTGFSRSISLGGIRDNVKMVKKLIAAGKDMRRILDRFQPDLVVGTGGYVCYPVLKAAAKRKIPTALHESNAVPGLTTKMLEKYADMIMVAFPGAVEHYSDKSKVFVVGTPVRPDFLGVSRREAKAALGCGNKPVVVSVWGSLGASKMNAYMADFIAENAKSGAFYHIHATGGGEEGYNTMCSALKERGVDTLPAHVDLRPYIHDMGTVMNAADLVLCRAGASTIAELTALGKPSVLVPSPNVTNNHQEKNAREVEKAGGAAVLLEAECTGDVLYSKVKALTEDPLKLDAMSKGAASLGTPNCVADIADLLLGISGLISG